MENLSFQQENKDLINKVRKNSYKKKKNFKWVTVLWVFGVIVAAVLILFLVFNALKPIQHDPYSQTINVTLDSEDPFKNSEEIKKIKFPSDFVDYNLIVRNDLQNYYDVYLRFKPLTYDEDGPKYPNIMELKMSDEDSDNFYYDEDSDTWYYLGIIKKGEELTICSQIGASGGKTQNEYANKTVRFYVSIEAIRATEDTNDIVWNDEASARWKEIMAERDLFYKAEENIEETE